MAPGQGHQTRKKFLPPWNAERPFPVLPVKKLVIRPAVFTAQGEISRNQLSTLFLLSALVPRKGAIIGQFMRPKRPADAQSKQLLLFILSGDIFIRIHPMFVPPTVLFVQIYTFQFSCRGGKEQMEIQLLK